MLFCLEFILKKVIFMSTDARVDEQEAIDI